MKSNRIIIQIASPVEKAFAYPLDPKNTPLWLDEIVIENTSGWPVKVGTIYKNKNRNGKWSEYTVVALKNNSLFEFLAKDKNYHCRYSYKKIDNNCCQLEYYEWVEEGELDNPFIIDTLLKLKETIEKS